jgi:valyl-tRNA synthetase
MRLPSVYNPSEYEADIYALWEREGTFTPKGDDSKGRFSMALPPPNANANLHIGYAITAAIHDVAVRYQRMTGKSTVMIPGADHAGFETQVVYEKHLAKEGKSRFDFSREELYQRIWDFVEKNKHNFQSQIRAMGVSCDWDRFTYTLDNKVVATAYETFKKMWDDGLIYRGQRVVNFCTFHGTSFSDIEVVHKEEKSKLWHIKYPLKDDSDSITVATTRPETMLGDTAVAVNPKDERYAKLVGKTVKLPLVGREIPIVADDMVDMEFGSGAVKITPAHDYNDYEVSQRHDLPLISIIGTDGKTTHEVPEKYQGLSVVEARKKVIDDLSRSGDLVDEVDYMHSVGRCYKCDTVIEPLLREQWFVKMEPLAKKAIEALKDKKIEFYPDGKRVQLIRYLESLKDWNISRQIAWGIPIPAFQNTDDLEDWIFDEQVSQDTIEVDGKTYKRDPDVFDTWFSSSSWPYVTLDYPHGEDFKKFYPLSLMDTAGEILYQWVSRMIMLGLYTTGEIPFEKVYIHGLILAEGGAKMSKSLGNVVDAMEIIASHGSDALRMGLINGRVPAVNRVYDQRKVDEARNFSNKLWNVARYVEDKVGDNQGAVSNPEPKTSADHWILNKLSFSIDEISKAIEGYRFTEAYEELYQFVWHDFADWYIESSKAEPNNSVLSFVLESALKLSHPFAPFVTEAIWQTLAWKNGTMLITSEWPKAAEYDKEQAKSFDSIIEVVSEARRIANVLKVSKPTLYFSEAPQLAANQELVVRLARLGSIKELKDGTKTGLRLTQTATKCWLDIDTETAKKYLQKLEADRQNRQKMIANLKARLSNDSYVANAPQEIVEQTRQQLDSEKELLDALETEIKQFQNASEDLKS